MPTLRNRPAATALSFVVATLASTPAAAQKTALTTIDPSTVAVASVSISGGASSIAVGQNVKFAVVARSATGTALVRDDMTWTSSNPAVVAASGIGYAHGVAPGVATLTAACEGKSASYNVTVPAPAPPPVTSITIGGGGATTLPVGAATQFSVVAHDATGGVVTVPLTWTSSNVAVAMPAGVGYVRGANAGSAVLTATGGAVSASVPVTVVALPPASVTITPATATVRSGSQITLIATLPPNPLYSFMGRPALAWSVSNGIATVSPTGVLTALSGGKVTVTARCATGCVGVNPGTATIDITGAK